MNYDDELSDAACARDLDDARRELRDLRILLRVTQQGIADRVALIFKLEALQAARKEIPA
jgi:hypothetical protein